jgi:hypothetical protein
MKKLSVLPVALAVLLATTIALAASDRKVSATFETLSASGVAGQADLQAMPKGGTIIHGSVRGLQPDVEYVSVFYTNGTCTPDAGSVANVIARFKGNPSGNGQFTGKVDKDLSEIRSISIQQATDQSLKACAAVSQ